MVASPDPPQQTEQTPGRAMSFGNVADAYDRARPTYPDDAVRWLVGERPVRVLELGAGTGKLTEGVHALGHRVLATDPSGYMLQKLRARNPSIPLVLSAAETIPVASRSVDVVVSGQAFHWFDVERTLPEVARVLRPGGSLAVASNEPDERIPWVKRLERLLGPSSHESDPSGPIEHSDLFEQVETSTFRFWQPLTQELLRDLVRSRSNIAVLERDEQQRVLGEVDELYDEYGRGEDGMLLPYLTHCFRASLKRREPEDGTVTVGPDDVDTDSLLIDFR